MPTLAALFVPGSRPDRFEKAFATQADAVIIDLEDAVAAGAKAQARVDVEHWLRQNPSVLPRVMVRVNSVQSEDFAADAALLGSLRSAQAVPHTVMLPMVEHAGALTELAEHLPGSTECIALIESALGFMNMREIAEHPRVSRLAFGAVDYAAEIGCEISETSLLHPRSSLAIASAAFGLLPPLDAPCLNMDDAAVIRDHARQGKALGFGGSLCIHPAQVPLIREGYSPSPEDIEWARAILATSDSDGAARVGDQMVDAPVWERARRILQVIESE